MEKEAYRQSVLQAARAFQREQQTPFKDAWAAAERNFAQCPLPGKNVESFRYSRLMELLGTHIAYASSSQRISADKTPRTAAQKAVRALKGAHRIEVQEGDKGQIFSAKAEEAPVVLQALGAAGLPSDELHLSGYPSTQKSFFPLINTLFLDKGFFLRVPDGVVLQRPICIFFDTHTSPCHTRHLIHMGTDSQACFVAYHTGCSPQSVAHENTLCEIQCGTGSRVEYVKIQYDETPTIRVDNTLITQARDSQLRLHTFTLDTLHTRNEVYLQSQGANTQTALNGLYILRGASQAHNHLHIAHQHAHTTSEQLYKGILRDRAESVFEGTIHIAPKAQKTAAYQKNTNLLLDAAAVSHSKPQLEIYADDVRCSHGCTSNFLDPRMMFYMRSRGLTEKKAQHLLLKIFAQEVVDRVEEEAVRADLSNWITPQVQPQ